MKLVGNFNCLGLIITVKCGGETKGELSSEGTPAAGYHSLS